MGARALLVLGVLAGLGCGTPTAGDEPEDVDVFATEVAPLLEQRCGTRACHASPDDEIAGIDPAYFAFPVDADGRLRGEARIAVARARAEDKLSAEGGIFADLVRKPLDESLGGLAHRGGPQFRSMTNPELEALIRWADGARPAEEPLPHLVERYRDDVQPILAERGCMLTNCHGSGASNSLILDPGVLGAQDRESTLRNYRKVVFHLNLDTPDPMLARLVRKTIPEEHGGIFHRGGNAFFEPGDPELETLAAFMRYARAQLGVADTGTVDGLVFVGAPPTPRTLWDIDAYQPGGDVYSLIPATSRGALVNLSAAHHTGPADIRDPSVSYDGRRVAFAMRRGEADCLNLYVMDIDGGGLVQITHDVTLPNGIRPANVEPVWGPDDRIYFVSTRAGVMADDATHPLSNIWRVDADGGGLVRMTYSADMEIAPAWRAFHAPGRVLEERSLDLTFTAVRGIGGRRHAPLMRVPPDFRADYHPHYGTQHPELQIFTQVSAFPDDREVLLLMDDADVWEGGALALIDRNLGPVISDGGEPSVLAYVDSLQRLGSPGEEVTHRGVSPGGFYRDPVALPDGTVVVSHAPGPIDLSDPSATPDTALYQLFLRERPGNRTTVDRRELLVDLPGLVETDPTPITLRRREEILDPAEHLVPGQAHGELLNFDLAVDMTVANEDSPSNDKPFDVLGDSIRFVRIVEQVPLRPEDYPDWPDTSTHRVGRGAHGIRRIVAEMPVGADTSYYAELPAAVPFFVQALDIGRMANATHNLWVFLLPGEKLRNVTRREVWDQRCSGCHGSRSGDPVDTVRAPDVLTQASRVVANWDFEAGAPIGPTRHGISPAERMEVDFERDVQPILEARCTSAGCHGAGAALDLTRRPGLAGFSGSYESLTDPGGDSGNGYRYVDAESSSARTSYLAEVIGGRDLDAPRAYDSTGCAAPDRLTLGDAETLVRWMDLGASYLGVGPREAPDLPELGE